MLRQQMSDITVICPVCERDAFFLERIPGSGEPFVFSLPLSTGLRLFFQATKATGCLYCGALVMIPWRGIGYKVITNKGLCPPL